MNYFELFFFNWENVVDFYVVLFCEEYNNLKREIFRCYKYGVYFYDIMW